MTAIRSATPRPLEATRPGLPAELVHLISQCLAKAPEDRVQTAQSIEGQLKALRRALESESRHGWKEMSAAHHGFEHDLTRLREAAERTVNLNPLKSHAMSFVALLLCYASDWARGLEILDASA